MSQLKEYCEHFGTLTYRNPLLGNNEVYSCKINNCPYNNKEEISLGGDNAGNICITRGLKKNLARKVENLKIA